MKARLPGPLVAAVAVLLAVVAAPGLGRAEEPADPPEREAPAAAAAPEVAPGARRRADRARQAWRVRAAISAAVEPAGARELRYTTLGPVPAGSRIAILRRKGDVSRDAVPSYFAADVLEAGAVIAGWEVVAVRGEAGAVPVGEPGSVYAAVPLRPTAEDGGAYQAQQPALVRDDPAALIDTFVIQEVTDQSAALYWMHEPGVSSAHSYLLVRAPSGTEPLQMLREDRLERGPIGDGPWQVVQLLPANARAFRDSRVPTGDYLYQLLAVQEVPIGPGRTQWRPLAISDVVPASVRPEPVPSRVSISVPDNDEGTHLRLDWKPIEHADRDTGIILLRSARVADPPRLQAGAFSAPWVRITDTPLAPHVTTFRDTLERPGSYRYAMAVVQLGDGGEVEAAVIGPVSAAAAPRADWFNEARWATLAVVLLMIAGLIYYLPRVRRDPESIFIRRIPGVDAIEEAVGRSTEMGRPVLYVTGVENIQNIQTIASLLCLGPVAEMTAEYDTELKVANFEALTMVVAEEIVRQGYTNAGRSDAHRPENVMFISSEQFAFAAGVNGIILRDKPATNIYLGRFFAESLILAETGYVTKSIQIAGTAEVTQLPFFIAACDYTIIGEELYAVSAYLSREPKLLATLKASDMLKVIVIATVVIGAVLATLGIAYIGPEIAQ